MYDLLLARRQGLEDHLDLMEANDQLATLGKVLGEEMTTSVAIADVAGNELLALPIAALGAGLLSVTKWTGGKALAMFNESIRSAGNFLSKTFDGNSDYIRKAKNSLKEAGYEGTIIASAVGSLTSDGQWDSFDKDLENVLDTMVLVDKHAVQVMDYLNHTLVECRRFKSVKNNQEVLNIVDKLDELKYPDFKLPERNGNTMSLSEILPGGRVIKFSRDKNTDRIEYSMSGTKPSGETAEVNLSRSEMSSIFDKLAQINQHHKKVKQHYEDYLSFIKNWSEMVKLVDSHLSEVEGLSTHVIAEAEQKLKGNAVALSFYSGLLPRVVNYSGGYIHGVLTSLTKLIN